MMKGKKLQGKYKGIPRPYHNSRGSFLKDGNTIFTKARINYPFGRRSKPRLSEIR